METLIVVGVVLAVLAVVILVVQIASRPPADERRWGRDDPEDYDDDYEGD
ncbi:hypothetical protein DFR70_110223 [Nocardia tenerifensis]|uniref:Uncharacterized protein n=1 Tax=Nocardia tenerifensis TaxID=228006 RepID=A0A318JZI7_9NOCA|nr:hypothetical protein [Nocardia tenerifensis]PXX60382.1 hypothetical protein DFR70_110223 [Nocardia tenerifensis]